MSVSDCERYERHGWQTTLVSKESQPLRYSGLGTGCLQREGRGSLNGLPPLGKYCVKFKQKLPDKLMQTITLDAGEMAVASVLAAMRHGINRGHQVKNSKVGPQSDYETDLDGLVAEIAFCRWKNICPDMTVKPRAGGADCIVDGRKVDIKATRRKDGRLLAVVSKSVSDVELYVLAIVNNNEVTFAGWASAKELLQPTNIIDLGHGPTYAMDQADLRPFKQ